MGRISEIVLAILWTIGMLIICVVVIAAVLLPFTWLASWWLGDEIELLNHPRRNALILGGGVLIVLFFLEFSPDRKGWTSASGRGRSWRRTRR
jgi:hypothetical protein